MHASDPNHYVLLEQFQNPARPDIHFRTTGTEIWDDTDGNFDLFITGIHTAEAVSAQAVRCIRGLREARAGTTSSTTVAATVRSA
jgi:cysteine synthase